MYKNIVGFHVLARDRHVPAKVMPLLSLTLSFTKYLHRHDVSPSPLLPPPLPPHSHTQCHDNDLIVARQHHQGGVFVTMGQSDPIPIKAPGGRGRGRSCIKNSRFSSGEDKNPIPTAGESLARPAHFEDCTWGASKCIFKIAHARSVLSC